MACKSEMNRWVPGAGLIMALLALSCSAESKNSGGTDVSFGNNSTTQTGTSPTGSTTTAGTPGGSTAITTNTGAPSTSTSTSTSNGPELGKDVCAGANVRASRITPTVTFVVDRSGSTADPYPGSTSKWQAMYDALMEPNEGVISKLQNVVLFGMVLFDGGDMGGMGIATGIVGGVMGGIGCLLDPKQCPDADIFADGGLATCPRLVIINPALGNYGAINMAYLPSLPGGTTPTALALESAYKLVPDQTQVLDQVTGDHFVVLCTDGMPNGCNTVTEDKEGPIKQVSDAAARGIKTYVIGVAAANDNVDGGAVAGTNAQAYLDELAKYGASGQPAFSPATKGDLVGAITGIIGAAVGCTVKLNGKVVAGKECSGTVDLNSQPLECNGPNGFKLVSENEIELQGTACEQFKKDPLAMVNAKFPCDSFILQ